MTCLFAWSMSCTDEQPDNSVEPKIKTRVVAHRGYWRSGAPENSLAAMIEAYKCGVYGSEFDVRLTADSVPIVVHDPIINGMEIQEMPFHSLGDIDRLVKLSDFLDAAQHLTFQLILDLKAHPDADINRRNARVCAAMVEAKQMQHKVEYLTFSISGGKEMVRVAPYAQVYYTGEDLSPAEVKSHGFKGLGHDYQIIRQRPQVFAEAKDAELALIVYTINDSTVMREMFDHDVDFIITDYPAEALDMTQSVNGKK